MPTTICSFVQRRYAHDQTFRCYPAFTEQFDMLLEDAVIWQPYTQQAINERHPVGGISALCTRDAEYWLTRSKIIFDISVEEMSQQRVMRQFGALQLVDPPAAEKPLPPRFHKYVSQISHPTLMHLLIVEHTLQF